MENSYKEVLEEVDHLFDIIEQSEEYQTYRSLENKMFQNKELIRIIQEIKKKEQELVKKEQFGTSSLKEEKEFEELTTKLEEFPIYQEYQIRQEELNEQFQTILSTLNYYFDNK